MQKTEGGIASIYLACRSRLARAVRRIVRHHDVEDILQEAFVRSFEAEGRLTIRNARAFLLRTARNVALDHVSRSSYRTSDSIDSLDERLFADDSATPEARVDAERRFITFCEAVGSLPEQCRRVFVLKKVYGMSQSEIARHLGIAESTVEKHIARGLQLCFERMESGAVGSTRAASKRIA